MGQKILKCIDEWYNKIWKKSNKIIHLSNILYCAANQSVNGTEKHTVVVIIGAWVGLPWESWPPAMVIMFNTLLVNNIVITTLPPDDEIDLHREIVVIPHSGRTIVLIYITYYYTALPIYKKPELQ